MNSTDHAHVMRVELTDYDLALLTDRVSSTESDSDGYKFEHNCAMMSFLREGPHTFKYSCCCLEADLNPDEDVSRVGLTSCCSDQDYIQGIEIMFNYVLNAMREGKIHV
jgi:hypothetical protein